VFGLLGEVGPLEAGWADAVAVGHEALASRGPADVEQVPGVRAVAPGQLAAVPLALCSDHAPELLQRRGRPLVELVEVWHLVRGGLEHATPGVGQLLWPDPGHGEVPGGEDIALAHGRHVDALGRVADAVGDHLGPVVAEGEGDEGHATYTATAAASAAGTWALRSTGPPVASA
jgi:hypothetical protein